MKYYIKKMGHQELGSIGLDGRSHRGRYMYVSMNQQVLELFPPLSKTIKNDCALLPIIPLTLKKKVYCNFVYHNDKFTQSDGTRNEYRVYFNSELEENQLLVKSDDIVILKRDIVEIGGEAQFVYFFELLSDHNSTIYNFCNQEISHSSIRGNHCVYDGQIADFEETVNSIKLQGDWDVLIDSSVTTRLENNNATQLAELFNSSSFRDFVLVGYNNICAISNSVISWRTYNNLEAAHIKPRSHGGLYLPDNGISLCRDLHWAFDKGFFTINNEFMIQVHPDIQNEYLNSFNGNRIRIPPNPFFLPNQDNLKYHQENVFGLFKTTGRL